MVISVTAYMVMEQLVVGVTSMESDGQVRSWTHLIHEVRPTGGLDPADPWDLVWLTGQLMSELAMEREPSRYW